MGWIWDGRTQACRSPPGNRPKSEENTPKYGRMTHCQVWRFASSDGIQQSARAVHVFCDRGSNYRFRLVYTMDR